MNKQRKLKMMKTVSLIVMLLSIGVMAASFIKPGPQPKLECAPAGTPSSGFRDDSQGGCPVTAQSFKAAWNWRYGLYGEAKGLVNRTAAVFFLLGLAGLITSGVMSKKAKKTERS